MDLLGSVRLKSLVVWQKACQCPLKVEATKFTEVGYVGKDVDSIIRDLVEVAVKDAREYERAQNRDKAKLAAENRILDVLLLRTGYLW